jgi:hypothetical protein
MKRQSANHEKEKEAMKEEYEKNMEQYKKYTAYYKLYTEEKTNLQNSKQLNYSYQVQIHNYQKHIRYVTLFALFNVYIRSLVNVLIEILEKILLFKINPLDEPGKSGIIRIYIFKLFKGNSSSALEEIQATITKTLQNLSNSVGGIDLKEELSKIKHLQEKVSEFVSSLQGHATNPIMPIKKPPNFEK